MADKKNHRELKPIIAQRFGLELFVKVDSKDENLYFDTSTLQLIYDCRMMKAARYIGAEKMFPGTDTPCGAIDNVRRNIVCLENLDISGKAKELILDLNVQRQLPKQVR